MGRTVYVAFFTEAVGGLNEELRLSCDKFFTLSKRFVACWMSQGAGQQLSKPVREA